MRTPSERPPAAETPQGGTEAPRLERDGSLRRVALRVAYEGSRFCGWQIQPHCESVEGRMTAALSRIAQRPTKVYGSGRTDAGVHALNQVAHADVPGRLSLESLRRGVTALAAPGIAVKAVAEVPGDFHARHSATGKIYRYHLFNRPYPPVFAPAHCWWLRAPLDTAAMREAAGHLLGEHDFSAFRSRECAAASPVRTLRRVELLPGEGPDCTLRIEFEASGFLQHMARILTGTLVAVGMGRLRPAEVAEILAGRDRTRAAMTAPGQGLHLVRVFYDEARFPQLRALQAEDGAAD